MSFIIAVHVNEGIVMASDSRTTYHRSFRKENEIHVEKGVFTTESTNKTFLCPNGVGISCCGDGDLDHRPITGYIEAFIREQITPQTRVDEIPNRLIEFFSQFQKIPDIKFIIAGYLKVNEKLKQKIYQTIIKENRYIEIDTMYQGATWDGETSTLSKILQPVAIKTKSGYIDLPYNNVNWEYFTLKDAIEFAKYAVEITINTMHYLSVVKTVGGPVDILVIRPEESFWYIHNHEWKECKKDH